MSYENAEPKVLKTLNSDGQVLDDAGNVISETSDYWVQLYEQTEPKVDKILKSDGTIVDAAGNLIQDTTEFNVKKYNHAEPIPAKYLHADGTIDENPGSGSGADLENNHQTTIDVSTYTEPVEVEPEQGKDGMKKNTVTLTNIPSGSRTLYCYKGSEDYEEISMPINYCYSFYATSLITETGNYTAIYGYCEGGDDVPVIGNAIINVEVENNIITFTDYNGTSHILVRDTENDVVI